MFNNNPNKNNCIMPEQPYCPCCKYGYVEPESYYCHGDVKWHCTYEKFIKEFNKKNKGISVMIGIMLFFCLN